MSLESPWALYAWKWLDTWKLLGVFCDSHPFSVGCASCIKPGFECCIGSLCQCFCKSLLDWHSNLFAQRFLYTWGSMIHFGVQCPELRSKTDKIYLKQRYCFERLNQSLPQRVMYNVLTATVWNLHIKLNLDFLQSAVIRKRHELKFSHFAAVKSMWILKGLVQIEEPCRRLLNMSTST